MTNDRTRSYDVKAVTIQTLIKELGLKQVALLKMDLEGAEYNLLGASSQEDFQGIDQVFVEFHHHAFDKYSIEDTLSLVNKLESFGYKSFSIDNHNFLFY